jgi:hypothetical protein
VHRVRLNPAVRFDARVVEGGVTLRVAAPVRGQGLRRTDLSDPSPALLATLAELARAGDDDVAAVPPAQRAELKRIGVLLGEHETPNPVALDLQLEGGASLWRLADVELEPGRRGPPEVPIAVPSHGSLAWVRDSARNQWYPHVLTRDQRAAVEQLQRGFAPRALDPGIVDCLCGAGILEIAQEAAWRRSAWTRALGLAGDELAGRGYTTVAGLLPPALVRAAGRYYEALAREGFLALESDHSTRFVAHREPFAEWLHARVAELLAPALARCTKRSYSFVSAYHGAATLPLHTDRPACEVTVSLCIAATEGAQGWPLHLQSVRENALVDLRLGIGHAAVFKGREIAHARPALPAGERFVSLLFHFVDEAYTGSLD